MAFIFVKSKIAHYEWPIYLRIIVMMLVVLSGFYTYYMYSSIYQKLKTCFNEHLGDAKTQSGDTVNS